MHLCRYCRVKLCCWKIKEHWFKLSWQNYIVLRPCYIVLFCSKIRKPFLTWYDLTRRQNYLHCIAFSLLFLLHINLKDIVKVKVPSAIIKIYVRIYKQKIDIVEMKVEGIYFFFSVLVLAVMKIIQHKYKYIILYENTCSRHWHFSLDIIYKMNRKSNSLAQKTITLWLEYFVVLYVLVATEIYFRKSKENYAKYFLWSIGSCSV